MSTVETPSNRLRPDVSDRLREEETSAEVVASGSMAEALGGIATVVLAIVGLAGVYPVYLTAIAALVLGAAFLVQGAAVASRFSKLLTETAGSRLTNRQLGGGMSAEFLGGAAGIVLGILSLLHVYPEVLLPISAIAFGGAFLLACGTMNRLNSLMVERFGVHNEIARQVAGDMVAAANGAQALVGLAAIILGIIGLVSVYPLTLTLVAFLCLGAAVILSGTAISSKMISILHR